MSNTHKLPLLEAGISHLEDLPISEFIKTIESLNDKVVTEKLDGANLWFGIDSEGLYTSREGKSAKAGRFYDDEDYAEVAAYNQFRSAHAALKAVEKTIRKHFEDGDVAEIEVLYGRQPNTVDYGQDKNYIIILRALSNTTDEKVSALIRDLTGRSIDVDTLVVGSADGEALDKDTKTASWEFAKVAPMDTKKIQTSDALDRLRDMKAFLKDTNELLDMTNQEVAELNLTSVPKEERPAAKAERERVNGYIMSEFKEPIKELLLNNFVRKIKPFLNSDSKEEGDGVEGVVIRDPVTGAQTKIVDKDVFTAINSFNTQIRNSISGAIKTVDQDAELKARGGILGQAKIRIAELLGNRELALGSGQKKIIRKFAGATPEETAQNMADSFNITSVGSFRTKISAVLISALKEINGSLENFKDHMSEYKLTLKTGKQIGLSEETIKRTLTSFAETKADIDKINRAVLKSETVSELLFALYGRTINAISDEEPAVKENMSFLKSIANGLAPAKKAVMKIAEKKFSLITSLEEDEGAGEGSSAPPPATPDTPSSGTEAKLATATGAGNVASTPFKLGGRGKLIQKRKRNFTKPKKFPMPEAFSLIKSVQEDWAHLKDMKFATDVDDKASAQSDVEFKQLRNNISVAGEVEANDVSKYLNKAHELNDEVDSVTFGLEADDGSIVKVWVNAGEADGFEAALSDLLGAEDDIEEVINKMSDTFDIVDVEWPSGHANNAATAPEDEPVSDMGDDMALDADADADAETEEPFEMNLDTESDAVEVDPAPEDEVDSDAEPADEVDPAPEDEVDPDAEPADEVDSDAEPADEDTPAPEDEVDPDAEPADEDTPDLSDDGEPRPKKKKKTPNPKTEESIMTTYGEKFKNRLLTEAKKPARSKEQDAAKEEDPAVVAARAKYDKQMSDLLKVFPQAHERAIITLMITLGAPVGALKIHKAELRGTIDAAAEQYRKSSSFRMWVNKLMTAVSSQEDPVVESAKFEKRLSTKYQRVVYGILNALGMPEAVERTANRQLLNGIRAKASIATSDSKVRVYLMAVADALGVADSVRNEPDDVPMNGGKAPNVKGAKPVKEDMTLNEDVGAVIAEVSAFLEILGFDVNSRLPIATQMERQPVKSNMVKLASSATLLKQIALISTRLEKYVGNKYGGAL